MIRNTHILCSWVAMVAWLFPREGMSLRVFLLDLEIQNILKELARSPGSTDHMGGARPFPYGDRSALRLKSGPNHTESQSIAMDF